MEQLLDCDDMCHMETLSESSILANLVNRYQKDKIYTSIGPTLISLNPYKEIPKLYNQEMIEKIKESVIIGLAVKEPHIFSIAGRAFQGMINQIEKQAVIISGESGAGKTESAKYCMQMLTSLSQNQENQNPIQEKILACNPILQAFGNSKTVRNQNSSRFGKYVQIFFGPDRTIRGATIKSYLLQKSRVTNVSKNERNFHIFYSLCQGHLNGAKDANQYSFLKQSQCFQAQGIDDILQLEEIKRAMTDLNFSSEEQAKIWSVLVAILDLGNITFDDSQRQNDQNKPCRLTDHSKIPEISVALGVSPEDLVKVLTYSKIEIPKQQCIFKSMDKKDCEANRNTLCKSIYNSIFQFILLKIQKQLNPPVEAQNLYRSFRMSLKLTGNVPPPSRFQINILDIFGFQNFTDNSLEQLCINYTNEKLLDLYNRCVFENELAILRQDGLQNQVDTISPPSNLASVELLDAIFRTIKDNTKIKHMKDEDIVRQLRENRNKNQYFNALAFDTFNKAVFFIHHSPCKVSYNVIGFKMKNQDKLTIEIESISSNLFKQQAKMHQTKTLLEKFTSEINLLNNELQHAINHYVRCIKPNEQKNHTVAHQFISKQIKYMGVFQTIQIRKKVFPCRKTYEQMINLFGPLFKKTQGQPLRAAARIIMEEIKASPTEFLMGTRRIYMNPNLQQKLNKKFIEYEQKRVEYVKKIQKYFKRKRARQQFRQVGFLLIQRVRTLKKWGTRVTKLVFCSFQLIVQRVKNKKSQIQKSQLQKSMIAISESIQCPVEPKQTTSEEKLNCKEVLKHSPLKNMSEILKKRSMESLQAERQISFQMQLIKQVLESKQNQLKEQKFVQLQLISRQLQLETEVRSAKSKITEKQSQIYSLNENLSNKQRQTQKLKEQLQALKQKNAFLTTTLHEKQRLCTELQQKLTCKILQSNEQQRQDIQTKIQQINNITTENLNLKHLLQSKTTQLNNLQHDLQEYEIQRVQFQKKMSEFQTHDIKSKFTIHQLEDMLITYEKVYTNLEYRKAEDRKKLEQVNKKYYKKCIQCQELNALLKDKKGKNRTTSLDFGKNGNKQLIEKLQLKVRELNDKRENLETQNKELQRQLEQYEKLANGVRESFGAGQRRKETKSAINTGNEIHLTTQELYSCIAALQKSRSRQELIKIREKICFLLP